MPARLAGAFPPSIRARDVQANSAAAFCAGFFLALSPFGTIRGKSRVNANRWRNAAIWLLIARESIALPVLRKDFMIDEAQILESATGNADAILLIVAAINPERLRSLHECATVNRLSALIEVHTREEVAIAIDAGAKIIGINNR